MAKIPLTIMKTHRLYIISGLIRLLPSTKFFALKRTLYRFAGMNIGKNVRIASSAKFVGTGNIFVGDNTWIGEDVIIVCTSEVRIGRNCDIAPRVYIGTGTHIIDPHGEHIAGSGISRPVNINDGCWLCVNSTILPGVSVGKKTIVAAGAVVTKDTNDFCIVGGIPASIIRKFDDEK